jgi:hypothetical protein
MSKDRARQTGSRTIRIDDTPRPVEVVPSETAVLYRQASGRSADELSKSTRGVRGKNVKRILGADALILPLLYEHQVERARQNSALESPPEVEELVDKLARMRFRSVHHSVVARVLEVHPVHDAAAVFVDYTAFEEDQLAITRAIRKHLKLSEDFEFQVGSAEPSIAVTIGLPRAHQLDQIRSGLPPTVDLSYVKSTVSTE